MKEKSITININEIRNSFMKDCEKYGEKFNGKKFQEFLGFLEVDFYDWVKENLRHFYNQKVKL